MEQLQLSVRLIAAALAVVFLVVIFFEKSRRDHESSVTEYMLMGATVFLAIVAITPSMSGDIVHFFSEVRNLASLPTPVAVPR